MLKRSSILSGTVKIFSALLEETEHAFKYAIKNILKNLLSSLNSFKHTYLIFSEPLFLFYCSWEQSSDMHYSFLMESYTELYISNNFQHIIVEYISYSVLCTLCIMITHRTVTLDYIITSLGRLGWLLVTCLSCNFIILILVAEFLLHTH